jgi:pimeloyl-ACP methyl ester carboxylesterase
MEGKPPGSARVRFRSTRGWRVVAALCCHDPARLLRRRTRCTLLSPTFQPRRARRSAAGPPRAACDLRAADAVRLSGGWGASESAGHHLSTRIQGYACRLRPWARFLFAAGYTVFLYDSRGCGQSDGWGSALGTREADDVIGAVRFLRGRADLKPRSIGALGISLGAGLVLLAAARDPDLGAVVASSACRPAPTQRPHGFHSAAWPRATVRAALIDRLIGARLEDTRPLQVIHTVAPSRAAHPLRGRSECDHAAAGARGAARRGRPKAAWTASGGHTGALRAFPHTRAVLSFFATYPAHPRQHGRMCGTGYRAASPVADRGDGPDRWTSEEAHAMSIVNARRGGAPTITMDGY